jgi:arabinan endo-1,5-alpha-L-arabinosidase
MVSITLMAALLLSSSLEGGSTDSVFPFDGIRGENGDAHDPSITEFGGRYFAFVTSGNSFSPIKESKDLVKWVDRGPAIADAPDWLKKRIPDHRSIWAPMGLRVGKGLRLYYCASEKFGANGSVIGVAENPSFDPDRPTEGWRDLGSIIESRAGFDNFNAIDPDVLIDQSGRHWMTFGSYWSGIYMLELDPATGKGKADAKPFPVASNTADRGNPLEAPALAFHDGYHYLFVTYGLAAQGIRSTYRMVCGRSRQPEGPYLGFDGKPMTEGGHTDLLYSSPPMFGPGGGNVFLGKDKSLYMAYHYYDARRHWVRDLWGRPTIQVRPIVWGSDGWPLPGLPIGAKPAGEHKGVAGEWISQVDFSDPSKIQFKADGTVKGSRAEGKWTLKGSELRIDWKIDDRPGDIFTDILVVNDAHTSYVGRNQLGKVIRGVRADAVPN